MGLLKTWGYFFLTFILYFVEVVIGVLCPLSFKLYNKIIHNYRYWGLDHEELPHVLDLAVHLVHLSTWLGMGGHTEILRYLATPTSRSYGWLITFSPIM